MTIAASRPRAERKVFSKAHDDASSDSSSDQVNFSTPQSISPPPSSRPSISRPVISAPQAKPQVRALYDFDKGLYLLLCVFFFVNLRNRALVHTDNIVHWLPAAQLDFLFLWPINPIFFLKYPPHSSHSQSVTPTGSSPAARPFINSLFHSLCSVLLSSVLTTPSLTVLRHFVLSIASSTTFSGPMLKKEIYHFIWYKTLIIMIHQFCICIDLHQRFLCVPYLIKSAL